VVCGVDNRNISKHLNIFFGYVIYCYEPSILVLLYYVLENVFRNQFLKADETSLKIRNAVNKRGKSEGTDHPSLKGRIVPGAHHPRDATY
jgi:hypothetical protein